MVQFQHEALTDGGLEDNLAKQNLTQEPILILIQYCLPDSLIHHEYI